MERAERATILLSESNRPDAATTILTRSLVVALPGTILFLPSFTLSPSPKRNRSRKGLPGIMTAPEETANPPGLAGRNGMTAHHRLHCSEEQLRRRKLPNPCANHNSSPFPERMSLVPGPVHKIHWQGGCINTDFTMLPSRPASFPEGENRSSHHPVWIPSFPAYRMAGVDQPS